MKVLFIPSHVLEEVLEPSKLVSVLAEAFAKFSRGETVTPHRTVMWVEGNWWGVMQSYVPNCGVGVKVVNVIPGNRARGLPTISALVTLYDPATGSPLAVIEGRVLTALRTAAASALSIKLMAPKGGGALAFVGTGYQARYHLKLITKLLDFTEVRAYDVSRDALENFKKFAEGLGLDVKAVGNLREVFEGARVVIEATTTEEPVILGKFLQPPVHVVSIGAHSPKARALDDEVVKVAEVIAVDSREACLRETGDIKLRVEGGVLRSEDLVELGEVVSGVKPGRLGDGITVFKSVGLAIQDACTAWLAYKLARERGLGFEVELG